MSANPRKRPSEPLAKPSPHPATIAHSRPSFGAAPARPPHAATIVQRKPALQRNGSVLPPHPATVGRRGAAPRALQRMELKKPSEAEEVVEIVEKLQLELGSYERKPYEPDDVSGLYNAAPQSVFIIGKSTGDYDCFNWSIGYSETKIAKPPITFEGIKTLYELLGFKHTTERDRAVIAVYVYDDDFAHHVAVKIPVNTGSGETLTWTSKLGAQALVAHRTNQAIVNHDYPETKKFWLFEKK